MTPIIHQKTGFEIKKEIADVYKRIKYKLSSDNSEKSLSLKDAIETYVASNRPHVNKLNELITKIYTYQNSLDKDISKEKFIAAEELLNVIKNSLHAIKLGNAYISNTDAAKYNIFGGKYAEMEHVIKNDVLDLADFSYSELFKLIMRDYNSASQQDFPDNMLLDFYSGGLTSSEIKENFLNISPQYNKYGVSSQIYNAINKFKNLSNIEGANLLVDRITSLLQTTNSNGDQWSISHIIAAWKNMISGFAQNVNYNQEKFHEIIPLLLIANLYDSEEIYQHQGQLNLLEGFTDLITSLTLDIYDTKLSPSELVSQITLLEDDYPNPQALVADLYNKIQSSKYSRITGEYELMKTLIPSNVYNIYTESSDIQSLSDRAIQYWQDYLDKLLPEEYSYHDLASFVCAVSSSVTPDPELVRMVEMDMIGTGYSAGVIASNIFNYMLPAQNQIFSNTASFTNSYLRLGYIPYLTMANNIYKSFSLGTYYLNLASAVENSLQLTSTPVENFVDSIHSLSSNINIESYNDLAVAIASLITPYSSEHVVGLETDLNIASVDINNIKNYLGMVNGVTSSSVAANIYNSWSGAYISSMEGARALASDIDNSHIEASDINAFFVQNSIIAKQYDQDYNYALAMTLNNLVNNGNNNPVLLNGLYQDFVASGLSKDQIISILKNIEGNNGAYIAANLYRALHFPYLSSIPGYNDLADLVEEYHNSDYVITHNTLVGSQDISPKTKFLNICTKDGDTYTTGASVFSKFDSNNDGKSLYAMQELFTISGRESARAQCGKYVSLHHAEDLYLTLTKPAGIIGTAEETGCTENLEPSIFLAYCEAVFAQWNLII